jgi:hypothetical protein
MSIFTGLLAAISFCFHVQKNKRYKRRAGLAPEKRNPSRQPLNKYRILSKKIFI